MTYFEIDPVVIESRRDPALLHLPVRRADDARHRLGDARLSLAAEPTAPTTSLVLDAFSSDSIPIHLLTVEAITDELRTVAPDGVIAFHISNRYYDLSPAIAAALDRLGLVTLSRASDPAGTAADEMAIPAAGSRPRATRRRPPRSGPTAGPWRLRPTTRSPTTTPTCSRISMSGSEVRRHAVRPLRLPRGVR